jgi:hypothetical protein
VESLRRRGICIRRFQSTSPVTQACWATCLAIPLAVALSVEGCIGFAGLDFGLMVTHSLAWALGYVAFGAAGPIVVLAAILWRPRSRVGVAQRVIRAEKAGFVVVATIAAIIVGFFAFVIASGHGTV